MNHHEPFVGKCSVSRSPCRWPDRWGTYACSGNGGKLTSVFPPYAACSLRGRRRRKIWQNRQSVWLQQALPLSTSEELSLRKQTNKRPERQCSRFCVLCVNAGFDPFLTSHLHQLCEPCSACSAFPSMQLAMAKMHGGVFVCHFPYSYSVASDEQEVMADCCLSFVTAF